MELQHRRLDLPLAVAAGIAAHLLYFRVGEHHMHGLAYAQGLILLTATAIAGVVNFTGATISDASALVLSWIGCWLAGVFSSLLVFRAFFHPLNKFPGPWQARLGDLWMSSRLTALNGYHVYHDLHRKYGQYVRVGSNTLSITDPHIMQHAYGAHARVTKGDWYDANYPHDSMHTTRDRGLHDRRRRVWAPAFSDKALREYEVTVQEFNDQFLARLDQHQGRPIDATTWFNLYGFDVMGRLAFGKDYGMLAAGERHWALDLLTDGMALGGLKLPVWLVRVLFAIPGAASGVFRFLDFCADELRQRVERGGHAGGSPDITGWLLKAYADDPHPHRDPMLQGDARLIVVAGSDTTSATLTHLFYHLARDPAQQQALRDELLPLVRASSPCSSSSPDTGSRSECSDRTIQHAPRLNGAINETLRLHPPVPSGLMRQTPPEGLHVHGRGGREVYVPGNTAFSTPQFPMGRDESIYPDPDSFLPERWFSRPELVAHPDAFAPFSQGPFNCIGRNLARMELRTLTAQILLRYRVSLAPGEDGRRLLMQSKDHFTMSLGRLDLVFTPIEG